MSDQSRAGDDIRGVLERLAAGELGVEAALLKLRLFQVTQIGDFARLDTNRDLR